MRWLQQRITRHLGVIMRQGGGGPLLHLECGRGEERRKNPPGAFFLFVGRAGESRSGGGVAVKGMLMVVIMEEEEEGEEGANVVTREDVLVLHLSGIYTTPVPLWRPHGC